jgi:hypothetical protein
MARGYNSRESGPYGEAGYDRRGDSGPQFPSSAPEVKLFSSIGSFEKKFSDIKGEDDQVFKLANGALTKFITTIDNPYEVPFSYAQRFGNKNPDLTAEELKEKSPELHSLVNSKKFMDSLEEGAAQRGVEEYSNWKQAKFETEEELQSQLDEEVLGPATAKEKQTFMEQNGPGKRPTSATYQPMGVVTFTNSKGDKEAWAYHSPKEVKATLDFGYEQSEDEVVGTDYLDAVELKSTPKEIFDSLKFTKLK